MSAAATGVDVHSVGLIVGDDHFGSELAQNAGTRFVGCAIRYVDGNPQLFERHFSREARLSEFNIPSKGVINPGGTSNVTSRRPNVVDSAGENQVFDLRLDLIVKFVAVMPEEFNAVVLIRIMRGGKNNARISPERTRDIRHARCR